MELTEKDFVCGNCSHFALTTEQLETGWCLFVPDLSSVDESMVNKVRVVLGGTYFWRNAVSCEQFRVRKPENSKPPLLPLETLLSTISS